MRVALAVMVMAASMGAAAEEPTGTILVAVGVCNESIARHPVVWFRKTDRSKHFSVGGAILGRWDYSDDTGRFNVRIHRLSAGEWEMFRHEMDTEEMLRRLRHRPRNDYSHRFTIAPGTVADVGRYCAATQTVGEKFPDSDKVWNQESRLTYLHVSPNRDVDVERARKPEGGGGAPLELVTARPDPPERVSPLLRSRFVEPRVIARPSQTQFPTDPPR